MKNASNERRKKTRLWFTYFQIADKYFKNLTTNPLNIILPISVYDDYQNIGLSSVVYIFHKAYFHKYCVSMKYR